MKINVDKCRVLAVIVTRNTPGESEPFKYLCYIIVWNGSYIEQTRLLKERHNSENENEKSLKNDLCSKWPIMEQVVDIKEIGHEISR